MRTTSAEVIVTFAVTPRARALLRRWQADPARPLVPRTAMRHTTHVLYELKPSGARTSPAAGYGTRVRLRASARSRPDKGCRAADEGLAALRSACGR
jgi:hypothetical protein